jgi:hypothetical protein
VAVAGPDILPVRNDVMLVAHGRALEADASFDEGHDVFSGGIAWRETRLGLDRRKPALP